MFFVGAAFALVFGIWILKQRVEAMNSVVLADREVGEILAYLGSAAISASSWLYYLGLFVA